MSMQMFRAHIDQPSTLQSLHHMHGTNVIADPTSIERNGGNSITIALLDGPVITMIVPLLSISNGWTHKNISAVELTINPVNPLLSERHQTYARGYKAGLEAAKDEIIKAGYPVNIKSESHS